MIERSVLPYSLVVGHHELRRALEIAFIDPGIGVLASGKRGTAKSTTIRAYSLMAFGMLPVTLPIGATDDRVLGGLSVEDLLDNRHVWRDGLLKQASDSTARLLYIDEANLLDDHLVNVILDVSSTGVLVVQRDNTDREPEPVRFALVGTMNPEEGGLRPQLLDRFGLMVSIDDDATVEHRRQVLEAVLRFEDEREDADSVYLADARSRDAERRAALEAARDRRRKVDIPPVALDTAARMAAAFGVDGHRGEVTLIRAARAVAALAGAGTIEAGHLRAVAKMTLFHRRPASETGTLQPWRAEDDAAVEEALREVETLP
ncbi:AAA family ATPase [Dactylosporangium sp. NPDC050588]|uniref:AAA family ATPase n=1 Tax=Dactylosporangium sp. NPDC050588 TaxID=3157211 RepID=UPI0033C281E5